MTVAQVEALDEGEARAVLDAWVKAKQAGLPLALRDSASRPHARLARKALYQLQSSGLTVEAPRTEAPPEAAPRGHDFPAVMSSQLGTGERVLVFAVPIRGGGLELFQVIVSDEFGLAQISSNPTNRQKYRQRLRELTSDAGQPVMLVSWARLQLELGRAIALNERSGSTYDSQLAHTLQRLGVTPQDPDVVIPPMEPGDEAAKEDGAQLHDEPEFAQWLPSEPDLVLLGTQASAVDVLPLDEAGKRSKKEALALALAAERFTPQVRALYARRLWYQAEYFEANERAEVADRARAEARRLLHGEPLARFAQHLYVKTLSTLRPSAGLLPARR